jgi:tRNA (cmo5U34)-methyltransferase
MNKSKARFIQIKEHFEKESAVFDKFFFKVMPCYEEMMQSLIDALPFNTKDRLRIVDLGCGTGNLSKKLILTYPNARIICIDMADNMLKMAKTKLKNNSNVTFLLSDILDFAYKGKYDVVVASMVLHHIESKDKPRFYRKIYNSLSKRGVFFCIDIFLSSNNNLQKLYMDKWKTFMKSNGLTKKKIDDMIFRHQREDRPVVFEDELAIIHKAGFKCVDVVLKRYNFAVYGGIK